jgi:hypothetical protein
MNQASKYDTDFWGLIICSYLTPNVWIGAFLALLAIFPLYKGIKERDEQGKTNLDNNGRGEFGCSDGSCKQSCQSEQQGNSTKASKVSCG